MVVRTSVRYNNDNQGWNGSYIPGQAFFNLTYHLDVDFHLTALNVPTGTYDIEKNQTTLYPNPAFDRIVLSSVPIDTKYDIVILDMTGREIFRNTGPLNQAKVEVDVSMLKPGTYSLLLVGSTIMDRHRIIKN